MPGPPILLSSYAAHVISCGAGVLSSLSTFWWCLSSSSELGWGSVELLRTSDVRVFFSECTLHPGLGLDQALWVFHAMFFSGSPSGSGGGLSFAFVTGFVTMCSGPSLAPRFVGFTVPA